MTEETTRLDSGVIVKRTPTIVVGGVQQYFTSYAIGILDEHGDEVSTVPVPSANPTLLGAVVWQLRQSIRPGFTVDYHGESSQAQKMEMFA